MESLSDVWVDFLGWILWFKPCAQQSPPKKKMSKRQTKTTRILTRGKLLPSVDFEMPRRGEARKKSHSCRKNMFVDDEGSVAFGDVDTLYHPLELLQSLPRRNFGEARQCLRRELEKFGGRLHHLEVESDFEDEDPKIASTVRRNHAIEPKIEELLICIETLERLFENEKVEDDVVLELRVQCRRLSQTIGAMLGSDHESQINEEITAAALAAVDRYRGMFC